MMRSFSKSASRTTDAVRPAADDALPEAKTPLGKKLEVHLSSALFAVAGSPKMHTLISPRNFMPSSVFFCQTSDQHQQDPLFYLRVPMDCGGNCPGKDIKAI